MLSKPKGGRGHVVPYQTTHVRIPVPLKGLVTQLTCQYWDSGNIPSLDKPVNKLSRDEILEKLEPIRKTKKIGKDTINQILDIVLGE